MCQQGDEVDRQGRAMAEQPARTAPLFKEKKRAACPGMTKQLRLHLFGNYTPISIACHACGCSKRKENKYIHKQFFQIKQSLSTVVLNI